MCLFYGTKALASIAEIKWQTFNPTTKTQIPTQQKNYFFLNWDQSADLYFKPFYLNAKVRSEWNLDGSGIFNFGIPELYFSYKRDFSKPIYSIQSIELGLGRKIQDWSWADKYWQMGIWHPLIRWNPLHPELSGLSGSFLKLMSHQWSFDLFLGALHFPHQEFSYTESEGRVSSTSRWFMPFPEQVSTLNLNIYYNILAPEVLDVVFQQSYFVSFKMWSKEFEKAHYWLKWSFADKPANYMFPALKKVDRLKVEEKVNVKQKVTVLPVRQRLLSAEWGLDYNGLSLMFALENVREKELRTPIDGWDFLQERASFIYFSSLLRYNFSDQSFVQAGYIQTWFEDYNINNVKTKGKLLPSILITHKVLEGIGLDWRKEFVSAKNLKRAIGFSYRYSFLNQAGWGFLFGSYAISPKFYVSASMDVVGSKGNEHYLLSIFRHNDYMTWSLAYDF